MQKHFMKTFPLFSHGMGAGQARQAAGTVSGALALLHRDWDRACLARPMWMSSHKCPSRALKTTYHIFSNEQPGHSAGGQTALASVLF